MKYWILDFGEYECGNVVSAVQMPNVECDSCGQLMGCCEISKLEALKASRNFVDGPVKFVDINDYLAIESKITGYLSSRPKIRPSSKLGPHHYEHPLNPIDFGLQEANGLIVSNRVLDIFVKYAQGQFTCINLHSPDYVFIEPDVVSLPPVSRRIKCCVQCGANLYDRCSLKGDVLKDCGLMSSDMVAQGEHLFKIDTTSYIGISDYLKQKLEAINPVNVAFERVL